MIPVDKAQPCEVPTCATLQSRLEALEDSKACLLRVRDILGCHPYDCVEQKAQELVDRLANIPRPVVPLGWVVGRFTWSPSRDFWCLKEARVRPWTYLRLRADGTPMRSRRAPAVVYEAIAFAVRTGERPPHAADSVQKAEDSSG
jgi:hypothetical protein